MELPTPPATLAFPPSLHTSFLSTSLHPAILSYSLSSLLLSPPNLHLVSRERFSLPTHSLLLDPRDIHLQVSLETWR